MKGQDQQLRETLINASGGVEVICKRALGNILIDALGGAEGRHGSPGRGAAALLERPDLLDKFDRELGAAAKPYRRVIKLPRVDWLSYMGTRRGLSDELRQRLSRYQVLAVEGCAPSSRRVRARLVCMGAQTCFERVQVEMRVRGLRPAHPLEMIEFALKEKGLRDHRVPLTSVGGVLRLRNPSNEDQEKMRVHLTLSTNGGQMCMYLEELGRKLPSYHTFLGIEL